MQKQLIQQVSQAMQANADTIERQQSMLDYQAQTIEELKTSLMALAETQTQELKVLPTLFEALETSLNKHTNEQKAWQKHRKEYVKGQLSLAEQLITLTSAQKQLTTALNEYQSTLVPADERTRDMDELEAMLTGTMMQLKNSQHAIQQAQNELSNELKQLEKLFKK